MLNRNSLVDVVYRHAIMSMIQFLIDTGRLREDEDDGDNVKTIRSSVSMMRSIVNDALDMTKIESGHLQFDIAPFSFREIIVQLCRVELPMAQAKGLKLTYNVGHDVPRAIYGDAARVRQVVINFISNAIKFTKTGSIHVELKVIGAIEAYENGVTPHFPLPPGTIPDHIKPITVKPPSPTAPTVPAALLMLSPTDTTSPTSIVTSVPAPAAAITIDVSTPSTVEESKEIKESKETKETKETTPLLPTYPPGKRPLALRAVASTIGMPVPQIKKSKGLLHPAAILAVTPPISAVPHYSHPDTPLQPPPIYPPANEAVFLELRVTDTVSNLTLLYAFFPPHSWLDLLVVGCWC
jgi:hypothetical protein